MFKRKKKEPPFALFSDMDRLDERVRQLECDEHKWSYHSRILSTSFCYDYWKKRCVKCGKTFEITEAEYLEGCADNHYKKHEACIDKLNKLNGEV